MTDITELAQAAEKYRLTLAAHRQNPRNYDALDAWDKATGEFMALVNNDELNIISSLLDKLETEEGYRKGAFLACNRWHNKFREAEDKLETEERRNAELVEALEKAQQVDEELCKLLPPGVEYMDPPDGGDVTPLEGVRRMVADYRQRIAELESRTVTDWIEHDGKWRPDSLSTDELVYLKTRKQELKIPYPAGKVMGWMHTGGDMDVMAYKLAAPQASTVTVKLPKPISVLHRREFTEAHCAIYAYPEAEVNAALDDAGIKWEAE